MPRTNTFQCRICIACYDTLYRMKYKFPHAKKCECCSMCDLCDATAEAVQHHAEAKVARTMRKKWFMNDCVGLEPRYPVERKVVRLREAGGVRKVVTNVHRLQASQVKIAMAGMYLKTTLDAQQASKTPCAKAHTNRQKSRSNGPSSGLSCKVDSTSELQHAKLQNQGCNLQNTFSIPTYFPRDMAGRSCCC